jgi:hypothetical protein
MVATLRGYWSGRHGYQTLLYGLAALLLSSAIFHLGVQLWQGGPWEGPVSWRKPITFGFSFGVTLLSLSWIMTFLPHRPRLGWLLAAILGSASVVEVLLISMQVWRGVPSHFNESTPFDEAVFSAMGTLVVLVGLSILVLTIWTIWELNAPPSLAWAIRAGLLLLLASQALGGLIIANGTNVGDPSGLGPNSTFGEAGAMKVPHALTLHAVQVLPLLAWSLLFSGLSESRRLLTVGVAALGYAGLTAVMIFQTFSGVAPFDMSAPVAVVLGSSVGLIVASASAALWGLVRTGKPTTPVGA